MASNRATKSGFAAEAQRKVVGSVCSRPEQFEILDRSEFDLSTDRSTDILAMNFGVRKSYWNVCSMPVMNKY
ncbi:hypothetical protein GWI33_013776 [Rhynchophorus ferrugineus]|uniref:Uncharacterized protein n=1 Tax=Rhynchophorus ferrugineus TaxID=354439 RepID=A0A834I8U3_RHYFE|nr:hypothetical protein GWI33_013776 [Rhynchophorus ferrugineus]